MSNTKIWAITIICIICGGILYLAIPSLTPLFIAVFLAYLIYPLVAMIQKRLRIKRKSIAVILALILIAAILSLVINSIAGVVVQQAMIFIGEFSNLSAQAEQWMSFPERLGLDEWLSTHVEEILLQMLLLLDTFIVSFITSFLGFILRITDVIIIIILLFLFLLDGPKLVDNIIGYMPGTLREAARNFFMGINGIVWGYLKTMVIISILFGLAFGVILFILGVPYAGLLGILGAVLNMIPYIGSIISGAIAVVVALIYHDIYRALISTALIVALNMLQGNIIAPLVLANKMNMHPILVITSLLVCNYIWGIWGMFLAVPILGLARLLMKEVLSVVRTL